MKNIHISTTVSYRSIIVLMILGFTSCNKFIEIDPPKTEIDSKTAFQTDASAISAMRGIYSMMMTNNGFTYGRLEECTGIASDELINYSTNASQVQFYQSTLTPLNGNVLSYFWQEPYKYISNANAVLEGINGSVGITASTKKQIEGEAKFIKAFCYFYLTTLFGDVPYVESTDYKSNSKLARIPASQIFLKIESDLSDARNLLNADYSFSSGEKIEPNKAAATALLSRVYLYMRNWEKAEAMATEVISNPDYVLLPDLDQIFLANSAEAIWQLQPVNPISNTPQGALFVLNAAPSSSSRRVSMTSDLFAAFEADDTRKIHWVNTFTNGTESWNYINKYKVRAGTIVSEYSTVLRLAEQYLIRAEARVELGNLDGSKEDLNAIRARANLPETVANDKNSLLTAIMQERRIELMGEYGQRWLDLRRTGEADAVLSGLKLGWQPTDTLFPIPQSEILLNTNLTQNPGF